LKTIALVAVVMLSAVACGKKDKEKSVVSAAEARLQMENVTGAGLTLTVADPSFDSPSAYTPTVFKMKILKIAIAQEKDTTKAPASSLYIDPKACAPEELEAPAENYSDDVDPADRIYYKYIGTEEHRLGAVKPVSGLA
jgi:hypothetical protein